MKQFKNSKSILAFFAICILVLFIFISFISNANSGIKKDSNKLDFQNVIVDFEKSVDQAEYLYEVAHYNAFLHSDDAGLVKLLEIQEKNYQNLINDVEQFKKVKALRDQYVKENVKGLKRNIVERWYNYLKKIVILDPEARKLNDEEITFKTKLLAEWNKTRLAFKDKKSGKTKKLSVNALLKMLRTTKDREERKNIYKTASKVADKMIKKGFKDLLKLRNKLAKANGFNDYFQMRTAYTGFDGERIFRIFDKVIKGTDSATKATVDNYVKENKLTKFEPWDLSYARLGSSSSIDQFFPKHEIAKVTNVYYKNMGLDLAKWNIKINNDVTKGRYPGAGTWIVKWANYSKGKWSGEEIRLMGNNTLGGINEYGRSIRGSGHAAHAANVKQKHTIDRNMTLTYQHSENAIMQSAAQFMARVMYEKDWFIKYANFSKGKKSKTQIQEIEKALSEYQKKAQPWRSFKVRERIANLYFEREMYRNPDADFTQLWNKTANKILHVGENKTPFWATEFMFYMDPTYYEIFVMSDLMTAQIFKHFKKKYGKVVDNPKIGRDLRRKVFYAGNSKNWEIVLKDLTGEKLNPEYLIKCVTTKK